MHINERDNNNTNNNNSDKGGTVTAATTTYADEMQQRDNISGSTARIELLNFIKMCAKAAVETDRDSNWHGEAEKEEMESQAKMAARVESSGLSFGFKECGELPVSHSSSSLTPKPP